MWLWDVGRGIDRRESVSVRSRRRGGGEGGREREEQTYRGGLAGVVSVSCNKSGLCDGKEVLHIQ